MASVPSSAGDETRARLHESELVRLQQVAVRPTQPSVAAADGPIAAARDSDGSQRVVVVIDDFKRHADVLRSRLTTWGFKEIHLSTTRFATDWARAEDETGIDKVYAVILNADTYSAETDEKRIEFVLQMSDETGPFADSYIFVLVSPLEQESELKRRLFMRPRARLLRKPAPKYALQTALEDPDSASRVPSYAREVAKTPVEALAAKSDDGHSENASDSALAILCVEDNPLNQMVLKEQLKLLGYSFHCASSGREALVMLADAHYDIVLMDIHMPKMDGFEVIRRVRAREGNSLVDPWIIAVTADVGARGKALLPGMANAFLSKPFRREDLRGAILDALKQALRGSA